MENKQAKLVLALGKKLKKEKKSKESIIISLQEAGILDKETNISKKYPTLRKAMSLVSAK